MRTYVSLARRTLLALGLTASLAFSQTVIIDPGHGGSEPGASYGGLLEKNLTLDVARRLAGVLQGLGHRVILTRQGDQTMSLAARRNVAAYDRSALFVSIHFNAAPNASATGLEGFYYGQESRHFATTTLMHMSRATGGQNRGVRSRGLGVLRGNPARAAILVECGFMSSPQELRHCADPAYRQQLAYAIAAGIHDANRAGQAPANQWAAARPARQPRIRPVAYAPEPSPWGW